ncbi:MAG: DUF3854 domain-containing protein [Rhizonema sp. NSF051]|nr:DUF3854 domain-containing protein [Rhizonema sp. NSF051]
MTTLTLTTTVNEAQESISRNQFSSLNEFESFIRNNFMEGSGIDPALFNSIEFHQDIETGYGGDVYAPIHEALGWEYKRFGFKSNEPLYAAFLKNEDGSIWQVIVSQWDEEKERPYKYLAPKNGGDRAYFPPVPPEIRRRIGTRYGLEVPSDGSFWEWLKEIDIPKLITEGGKKSLSALSQGYVAISLYGCRCGAKVEDEQGNKVDPYLIPDLQPFAEESSKWLFAFDRDEKQKAQIAVAQGKKRLTQALHLNNCLIGDIEWKTAQGKGLDDVMVHSGSSIFDAAYIKAIQRLERQFSGHEKLKDLPKKTVLPTASRIAREIAKDYGGKLLWNNEHKTWMVYEIYGHQGVWSMVDEHYVETLFQNILQGWGIIDYATDAYIVNIRKFISRILVTFQWNERKGILPFEDGIVDIETGKFEPHSPENRLTWCLPRKYNTPLISDWGTIRLWLTEAWSDEQDRETLLCFAAAVIRQRYDLQKFLYLVGTGGSGKGTYSRLLQAVIGDQNVWSGKIENLSDKNDCAYLVGKPLAIFADQDKVTNGLQLFKNLTGQDNILAKRLYKDSFNFIFTGLSLITANAPALLGAGSWIKRRAIVVNCNYQPTKERNLDAEFAPEIAAFTRYLLSIPNEHINRILRDNRPTSGSVTPAFWELAQRQDSIAAWLEECVVFEEAAFTSVGKNKDELRDNDYMPDLGTLFGSYHHFCRNTGLQGKSLTNFAPELEELCQKVLGYKFVHRHRNVTGVRGFQGIRLRRETERQISDNLLLVSDNLTDNHSDNREALSSKTSDNPDNLLEKNILHKSDEVKVCATSPPASLVSPDPLLAIDSQKIMEKGCQGCQDDFQNNQIPILSPTDNPKEGQMSDTKPDNPTNGVVAIEKQPGVTSSMDTAGDRSEPEELPLLQNSYPNVSSQNVEISWTTTLSPGSTILFQHQYLDGWRKGVIEEVIIVNGIFVKAVIQANVKKRGKLIKHSFDVHRDDWIKRRFR